jgi:signal transduction histidine kinase/ligand-binding sensor domain-containing protein/AraC-like DNA-binding protein
VYLYSGNALITPHITSIIESINHEIWITTSGHGIIRIKKDDLLFQTDEQLSSRLSSMYLTTIFQDQKGRFWIASENQGLNLYNPVTNDVVTFKSPSSIGSNQISTICEDEHDNLFVGTLTNGLYKLNANTQTFEVVPYKNNQVLSVKSLLVDNKKRVLVGTDGQGIKIFNEKTQCLEDIQLFSVPFDLSRMKVHAILQDRPGNIWIGLFQKGVFLDPENSNKFNYWGHKSYNQNVIGSGCVTTLIKDKKADLWIGTDNDGIYQLDKQGNARHLSPSNHPASVPNTILSMIEDDAGNIWLGSYLQGLSRLDKQTGKCTYYNNYLNDENTAQNKIFCLEKDNRNRLWIGTNGAGIYVFDLSRMEYIDHYSLSSEGSRKIPNNWINCIRCDKQGIIWVGSYNGFVSINPADNHVETYTTNKILPGDVVYCIHEDEKGKMWIGTTEGLACFDRETQTSIIYTSLNGLPSNVICSLLDDNNGNLWLSTHLGISKLNVAEKRFVNYYAFDGLQGNEFSMGASFKSKEGELFFGGTGGISSFYPAEINDQRVPLNLYLTGLYLMDKPIVSGQKSGRNEIFKGFISDVDTIRLGYKDNLFAMEFSTFDFGFSGRIYYQYLLEGLHSQWMSTEPGGNRINFTNLNYGTYRLKIKAFIYGNSSEEKIITLIITPPWYLSTGAIVVYAGLLLLFIWGITWFVADRIRHKNELLKRNHAEQISEAKLQFFINISHEIRTPMTLIISPLEKLISENKDAVIQKSYLLIYRNAQRILQLINQLMDVRKIDKGLMSVKFRETDMVGFIDDLMQTFEYQAKKLNIRFSFVHADEPLMAWIDLNNFDKVLVNILSNAFKFTHENGEITITLRKEKDCFKIIVSDTGPGIEETQIEKIFERFYQIDNNETKNNFGTGVGLHLARSLVELQHGVLFARNRSDCTGSEFIIRLPLGVAHLSPAEKEEKEIRVNRNTDNPLPVELLSPTAEKKKAKVRPKTKYRVLIVDDENEIRQYLRDELSDIYHVSESVNGKEALNIILKEKPDLIISDVMMPEMDGITLTKKLKSNINVNQIPVILLTAKATDEDKVEGFDTGADAYISKPFNIDLLKKIISNLFENRERLKQRITDSEENKALIEPIVLKPSDQLLYEKVIKIINDNIADPDLNVEFLANGVGMSRVHMHRKLKELTNQSARDFIKTIRLKHAAELLSNQKLTVSEVAYALGFINISHFSNSFREFHGVSPKEFQQR